MLCDIIKAYSIEKYYNIYFFINTQNRDKHFPFYHILSCSKFLSMQYEANNKKFVSESLSGKSLFCCF